MRLLARLLIEKSKKKKVKQKLEGKTLYFSISTLFFFLGSMQEANWLEGTTTEQKKSEHFEERSFNVGAA